MTVGVGTVSFDSVHTVLIVKLYISKFESLFLILLIYLTLNVVIINIYK